MFPLFDNGVLVTTSNGKCCLDMFHVVVTSIM